MLENQQMAADFKKFIPLAKEIVARTSPAKIMNMHLQADNLQFSSPEKFSEFKKMREAGGLKLTPTEFAVALRLGEVASKIDLDKIFAGMGEDSKRKILEHILLQESSTNLPEKAAVGDYLHDKVGETGLWENADPKTQSDALNALGKMVHGLKAGKNVQDVKNILETEDVKTQNNGMDGVVAINAINEVLNQAGLVENVGQIGQIGKLDDLVQNAEEAKWQPQPVLKKPVQKPQVETSESEVSLEQQIAGLQDSKKEMSFNASKQQQSDGGEKERNEKEKVLRKYWEKFQAKLLNEEVAAQKRFQNKSEPSQTQTFFQKNKKGLLAGALTGGAIGGAGLLAGIMQMLG